MKSNKAQTASAKTLAAVFGAAYCGEPCRICGKLIAEPDLASLVFAGYSTNNVSRTAHGICWQNRPAKTAWAFPIDAMN